MGGGCSRLRAMDTVTPLSGWRDPFITRPQLDRALDEVITPDGIQASSRESFKGAIFGRDSLEVGLDVVDELPELAHRILLSVVRHIGVRYDEASEEEPGKGMHEHRSRVLGGEVVGPEQIELLERLSKIWGGNGDYVTYFGAVDTGALYLDLLHRYCMAAGNDVLNETFPHARTGESMSIRDTVVASAEWYVNKIASSDIGLVEFHRINPKGLWFQVMRDGHDGMVGDGGAQANPNAPIAAIEIQAVAHAGLTAAAALIDDAALSERWTKSAELLQQRTIERLWWDEEKYFARAVYRDPDDGAPRMLRAIDTAGAELLRSSFFDSMPEGDKARYVAPVIDRLFSDEFLTPVGPRMLSMRHRPLFDYVTYQGCNVVWPTVVKRIADGLYRQGFNDLGADLDARIIECCERYRDFPEYVFVEDSGHVVYRTNDDGRRLVSAHGPMTIQAWTASGAFGAFTREVHPVTLEGWRRVLAERIAHRLWQPHTAFVDRHAGSSAESAFYESKGHGRPALAAGWRDED